MIDAAFNKLDKNKNGYLVYKNLEIVLEEQRESLEENGIEMDIDEHI